MWSAWKSRVAAWPWVTIGVVVFSVFLLWKLLAANTAAHSMDEQLATAREDIARGQQLIQQQRHADSVDAVARQQDRTVIDSLWEVINAQKAQWRAWTAAKAGLHPVDTTQTVIVQLAHCQEDRVVLIGRGDQLAAALETTTVAADSAIAVHRRSAVRAESLAVARGVTADSLHALLADVTKQTHRSWWKKLVGGTAQVVTTTGTLATAALLGHLFWK